MLIDDFPRVATGGPRSGPRSAPVGSDRRLAFRTFVVDPGARLLLCGGQAVGLGSRAFDLLMVLLTQRGRVVSKVEIFSHVWPDVQVEESNLRFQMAALRHVLGADRDLIKTVPGRGYLFVKEGRDDIDAAVAPAAPGKRPAAGPALHGAGEKAETGARAVAIIEDHSETREALEGLLQSAGLPVESFASVQAYNSHARAAPPGCLVLDVLLPGQSGLDFQAELLRSDARVPIIFISGHADVHMGVEAMKAGAFDFLVKPVRHRDLLDAIHLALLPRGRTD